MAKMGRPIKEIDYRILDKLCAIQCTEEEIALWFECTVDTIENAIKRDKGKTFSEYFAQKRKTGRISLRRKQWEIAMTGNVVMLIWLGKQYLDQIDKQEISGVEPIQLIIEHVNKKD
ncbi:MAG: hypothetical protein ACYDIA_01800 [Candidatus Humimicrobiaceae bacterium]